MKECRSHTTGPPQSVTGSGNTLRLNVKKAQTVKTMFRNKNKANLAMNKRRRLAGKFGKDLRRSAEVERANLLHIEVIKIGLVSRIAILELKGTNTEELKITGEIHIFTSMNIVSPSRLNYIKNYMTPLSICQEENEKKIKILLSVATVKYSNTPLLTNKEERQKVKGIEMKSICAMRLVGIINPPLVYVNASKIFCKATQKFFDLKASGIDIAKGRVDMVAKPARHGADNKSKGECKT